MKNKEMLKELKRVQPMIEHIKDIAFEIVNSTFDYYCCNVEDIFVTSKDVIIQYEYSCRGEYGHESTSVPIEWFDEGFDYRRRI